VRALESVLDNPDASDEAKINAANIVFDRQLGKPKQEIDQKVTEQAFSPEAFEALKRKLADMRQQAIDEVAFLRWKRERDAAGQQEPDQAPKLVVVS
jgi:hypothetical protein